MDFNRTNEEIVPVVPEEQALVSTEDKAVTEVKPESVNEAKVPTFTPVENSDADAEPRNLQMLVALAVAAIAFLILIAVLATWLYHRSAHNSANQKLPAPPPQNLQAQ